MSAAALRRISGLTLIELLLTVTLFSTLLGAVAGLVRSGLSLQSRFGSQAAPALAWERALPRLEADLQAAQPHFGIPWTGTADTLIFARVDNGAWQQVTYRWVPEEDAVALVRETRLWGALDGEAATSETLLRGVAAQWAFAVHDAQGVRQWVMNWDDPAWGLPKLMRLDYTLRAPGGALARRHLFRHPAGHYPVLEEQP